VLGSGSSGNATLVADADRYVLIDVGLSCREVTRRLSLLGVNPSSIDAIVITHAHGDHTRGAQVFSRRHDVPIYVTEAIRAEWRPTNISVGGTLIPEGVDEVCGFRFLPFTIPHDSSAVGFQIETADGVIGYVTDVGKLTNSIIERLRACHLLVVESNHAEELLRFSPYARSVRERISGDGGHLSNEALAAFIKTDLGPSVRCIVLAHLSRVNNLPEIAATTCREALAAGGREEVNVVVAQQDRITPTIDLSFLAAGNVGHIVGLQQTLLPF
tara:strand:- start:24 stop:839 length:816 start_codon:yes stop_codon:yes gene_type:complete